MRTYQTLCISMMVASTSFDRLIRQSWPLLWFLFLMLPRSVACSQELQEIGGLVHATALNSQAIRQADVLIRVEKMHDVDAENAFTVVNYIRMRVDWDSGRCVALKKGERIDLSSNERTAESTKGRMITFSGVVSNGKSVNVSLQKGISYSSRETLLRELQTLNIPDFRVIGLLRFPTPFASEESVSNFDALVKQLAGTQFSSEVLADGTSQVKFGSVSKSRSKEIDTRWTWTFSADTNMPTHLHDLVLVDGVENQRTFRETITWKKIAEVFVPDTVAGDKLEVVRNADVLRPYESQYNAQFHWFSVNQPLNDEPFDASILSSFDRIEALVNPTLAKATDINEKLDRKIE